MAVMLAGSAASLVIWPVHKPQPAAVERAPVKLKPREALHARLRRRATATPVVRRGVSPRVHLSIFASRGPSALVVRRGSSAGPLVYEGTLAAGHTMTASAPKLYTRIGTVANVDVRVGSRMLDLTCTGAGGVVLTPGHTTAMAPPACPRPPTGAS
jgi:hypothetical protein